MANRINRPPPLDLFRNKPVAPAANTSPQYQDDELRRCSSVYSEKNKDDVRSGSPVQKLDVDVTAKASVDSPARSTASSISQSGPPYGQFTSFLTVTTPRTPRSAQVPSPRREMLEAVVSNSQPQISTPKKEILEAAAVASSQPQMSIQQKEMLEATKGSEKAERSVPATTRPLIPSRKGKPRTWAEMRAKAYAPKVKVPEPEPITEYYRFYSEEPSPLQKAAMEAAAASRNASIDSQAPVVHRLNTVDLDSTPLETDKPAPLFADNRERMRWEFEERDKVNRAMFYDKVVDDIMMEKNGKFSDSSSDEDNEKRKGLEPPGRLKKSDRVLGIGYNLPTSPNDTVGSHLVKTPKKTLAVRAYTAKATAAKIQEVAMSMSPARLKIPRFGSPVSPTTIDGEMSPTSLSSGRKGSFFDSQSSSPSSPSSHFKLGGLFGSPSNPNQPIEKGDTGLASPVKSVMSPNGFFEREDCPHPLAPLNIYKINMKPAGTPASPAVSQRPRRPRKNNGELGAFVKARAAAAEQLNAGLESPSSLPHPTVQNHASQASSPIAIPKPRVRSHAAPDTTPLEPVPRLTLKQLKERVAQETSASSSTPATPIAVPKPRVKDRTPRASDTPLLSNHSSMTSSVEDSPLSATFPQKANNYFNYGHSPMPSGSSMLDGKHLTYIHQPMPAIETHDAMFSTELQDHDRMDTYSIVDDYYASEYCPSPFEEDPPVNPLGAKYRVDTDQLNLVKGEMEVAKVKTVSSDTPPPIPLRAMDFGYVSIKKDTRKELLAKKFNVDEVLAAENAIKSSTKAEKKETLKKRPGMIDEIFQADEEGAARCESEKARKELERSETNLAAQRKQAEEQQQPPSMHPNSERPDLAAFNFETQQIFNVQDKDILLPDREEDIPEVEVQRPWYNLPKEYNDPEYMEQIRYKELRRLAFFPSTKAIVTPLPLNDYPVPPPFLPLRHQQTAREIQTNKNPAAPVVNDITAVMAPVTNTNSSSEAHKSVQFELQEPIMSSRWSVYSSDCEEEQRHSKMWHRSKRSSRASHGSHARTVSSGSDTGSTAASPRYSGKRESRVATLKKSLVGSNKSSLKKRQPIHSTSTFGSGSGRTSATSTSFADPGLMIDVIRASIESDAESQFTRAHESYPRGGLSPAPLPMPLNPAFITPVTMTFPDVSSIPRSTPDLPRRLHTRDSIAEISDQAGGIGGVGGVVGGESGRNTAMSKASGRDTAMSKSSRRGFRASKSTLDGWTAEAIAGKGPKKPTEYKTTWRPSVQHGQWN